MKDRFSDLITFFLIALLWLIPSTGWGEPVGWHQQTLPVLEDWTYFRFRDVKALSGSEAWISGSLSNGEAAVLKTLDGDTWNLLFRKGESNPDPLERFWEFGRLSVVDSNTAWAAGIFGLTAFTTDGGATWSHEGSPCGSGPGGTPQHNYGLKAVDAANVWTTGWLSDQLAGQIWHRPYYGDCTEWGFWPWRLEAQYGYATVLAIDAADDQNAWAVGYPGLLHTKNGGATWVTENNPAIGLLRDVDVVSPSVAWAVGNGGVIVKTIDGGANWCIQGSGVATNLNKISAVNANIAWAVGGNGTIIKTIDGGIIWRSQVSGVSDLNPTVNLVGVAAVDANTAWAISDHNIVLHVRDGGVYEPLSAPGIQGVSPAGSPAAGSSQSVWISGRDFRPGAHVFFGDVPAASVEFRSSWELMAMPPSHAAGIVDVMVVNPDGQSATKPKAFAFAGAEPLIVYLSPSYGYLTTQVTIDILGAGLTPDESSYEPVPTVNINGNPVSGTYTGYTVVNVTFDRSLLNAVGMAEISVTTAAGTSNTLPFTVNYGYVEVQRPFPAAPKSATIPSLSGPIQTTFYGLTWDGYVQVGKVFETPGWLGGGSPPPGYTFLQAYYYDITATPHMYYQAATICIPYAQADLTAAGFDESKLRLLRYVDYDQPWEDITFTRDTTANLICGTVPTSGLMTYFALAQSGPIPPGPVITTVEPAIGPPAGGMTVTIDGGRFSPNAALTFGGVPATDVTVLYGTRITATLPAHVPGIIDVVVTNSDAQATTLVRGFEYVGPPTVTSVTPDKGRYYTEVTIKGTCFRSGNNGSVKFDGVMMPSFGVIDDTTIVGYAPQHAAGLVDVMVTNPYGQSGTLASAFAYVPAPTVTNVEPNKGPLQGGTAVTITGTGFQEGATVEIVNVEATSVVVVNPTTLLAVTPPRSAGFAMVKVINPDGQYGYRYPGFTYIAPGKGDLNSDGVVNIKDAVLALQVLSMWTPSPNVQALADVDVNGDSAVGMAEVIYILQRAAGLRP